jgi:type IV pilus assembly protein PilY1
MINMRKLMASMLTLLAGACALSMSVRADDIDIFLGNQTNTVNAPNIIFVIDNTDNWSAADQKWPDAPTQGQAEVSAINTELNVIKSTTPANVGLVMLSSYSGSSANGATPGAGGGYVRFAVRDMTVAANKTALQNILGGPTTLGGIYNNITDPNEKMTGQSSKDEGAAFYEIYKYLSGLAPYTGTYSAFSPPAKQNQYVDVAGNLGVGLDRLTGAGQGLLTGFAISGGVYQSPLNTANPCAATYIIYIANNSSSSPPSGQSAYEPSIANVSPALAATAGLDTWLDEWTHFLNTNGVVVPSGNNNGAVITYVLDAYNAKNNAGYSNSLIAAAKMGGGKYFQVSSQAAITNALAIIFSEIQAVNSTFASASLPVNTTNRSQNLNQVFIPQFRPDPQGRPLWMGNLKQYQVVNILGSIELGDNSSPPISATNPLTGFLTPCAQSFWTTDSGTYWQSDIFDDPPAKGTCPKSLTGFSKWSDAPDGQIVEKGGVAEVIRKGNNPPATNTTPTWAVNRTIYTLNGLTSTNLQLFKSTTLGGTNQALANFMVGQDVNDENANGNTTEARPSLHGDEIHSRPTPVDYGASGGVVAYYGSNDGMLRAINASTGAELWAFVAPEFYTSNTPFTRLMNDSPQISYPGMPAGITPTPIPKDYYFDGNIGLYQTANNSSVWIFPSMRRGGRTVYAFDVTNPASPSVKWKIGCPYPQGNNTGCTAGMTGIGQTWSTPAVATSVLGHTGPVVVIGGGYDTCEDANTATPTCTSPQGAAVYVIAADTGAILATFPTTRSVVGDVAMIAVANAGVVDHVYAADTGGNIYRIDFASLVSNWAIHQVAYTTGSGRKFLYAPAVLSVSGGNVYVALGSGDREHPLQSEYPYGGVTNRFYVYLDNLGSTSATNLDGPTMFDYTTLPGGAVGTTTSCSTTDVLPGASMKGWFMNLNQYGTGEQTVTSALIAEGLVAFSTNRPIPTTAGTCANLGQALGYWVNLFNASGAIGVTGATCGGARASMFTGGGLPPSPVIATVVVSGVSMTVTFGTSQLGVSGISQSGTTPLGNAASLGVAGAPPDGHKLPVYTTPVRKKLYWKSSGEN